MKMSDINAKRGSEWRKWDLHLHSLYSHLNNEFPCEEGTNKKDINAYIEKIKDSGISVVGLTNYFNFIDDDFELKEKLEKEGVTVFLNLELRLENTNNNQDNCDIHVIFDNQLSKKDIQNFLTNMSAKSVNEKLSNLSTKDDIERAVVNFDDLKSCLEDKSLNLNNRHLVGILSRGKGNSRSSTRYADLADDCDFFIHSSDSQNNVDSDKRYINGHGKPLLQSSDAHKIDQIGDKYSWIKADLSFEGLKQILFEPKDRVCLQKEKPETKNDEFVIDKIVYNDKEFYLSNNLNTIIGGRSTGKSTLLNSIAKKFGCAVNKFIFDEKDELQIFWQDSTENYERKVEYIPQEFMFKIANDKDKFDDLIQRIIHDKNLDMEISNYEKDCDSLYEKISNELKRYFEDKRGLNNLQKPEVEIDTTRKRITELEKQKTKILSDSNFNEEEKEKFNNLEKQLKKKKENIQSKSDENDFLESLKTIGLINRPSNLTDDLEEFLNQIEREVKEKWKDKINQIITTNRNTVQEQNSEIKDIKIDEVYVKGLEISKSNQSLSQIDEILRKEKENLFKIEKFVEQEQRYKDNIKLIRNKILKEYIGYKTLRENLEKKFQITDNDELKIELEFDQIDFEKKINYLNGKNRENKDFIENLNENFENNYDIFEKTFSFNQGKNLDDMIRDFYQTHFYEYHFKVTYQNDEYKEMSQGKQAFVILKLILEFSESQLPVLIDQPEDSLDNRAIYNELVKYITDKKKERQMIVVTHNPNIVIGADAENIIVANQHSDKTKNINKRKFDYVNGSIENTRDKDNDCEEILNSQGIREHIFEILEGGKEAFEKRKNKYQLKRGEM